MQGGIFINVKDVMVLKGYNHYQNAYRYLSNFAKKLEKPSVTSITIDEFCEYHKIKKELVLQTLNRA